MHGMVTHCAQKLVKTRDKTQEALIVLTFHTVFSFLLATENNINIEPISTHHCQTCKHITVDKLAGLFIRFGGCNG